MELKMYVLVVQLFFVNFLINERWLLKVTKEVIKVIGMKSPFMQIYWILIDAIIKL